jgi:hypothetical protein
MKGVLQRELIGGWYSWNAVCGSKDIRWLKNLIIKKNQVKMESPEFECIEVKKHSIKSTPCKLSECYHDIIETEK